MFLGICVKKVVKIFKWFYFFDFLWILSFVLVLVNELISQNSGIEIITSIWSYIVAIGGIFVGIVFFFVIGYLKKVKEDYENE